VTPFRLFPKAILKAEWEANAPLNRERLRVKRAEKERRTAGHA
jgi:hypothetical protein